MSGQGLVEIFLLALPWVWIAAAAFILARLVRRSSRPAAVRRFAIALTAYGMSDFFVTPHGRPGALLIAWKAACLLAMVLALAAMRGGEKK